MYIDVKNVKFGDCSILCGESEKLLIDCGSSNRGRGLSSSEFPYSMIANEINKKEIEKVLISHFDWDHFNGILEIPDYYRLKMTYLPYSIIDGKSIYGETIANLLSVASSESWGFKLSEKIINLFEKLDEISINISFVQRGDRIPFDYETISIHWPEIDKTKFLIDNLSINDNIEYILGEILNVEHYELAEARNNFIEQFEDYLSELHNNENNTNRRSFEPVYGAYLNLDRQRRILREERLNDSQLKVIDSYALGQYHSLIKSMNAISIVFDNKDRFLFLGDAPTNVVEYIRPSLKDNYKVVKIQHHGTNRYYTNDTPWGTYNVISNGGYSNRGVSDKFITHGEYLSREFDDVFLKNGKIVCTNAHDQPDNYCNFYIKHMRCSSNCIQVNNSYVINI